MEFKSMDYMKALQQLCNNSADFERATTWADDKVVVDFGDKRYWLKIFKGKIIDLTEYPADHPLGYDIIVSGPIDNWEEIRQGRLNFWASLFMGSMRVDGNHLSSNRLHEAISIMLTDLLPKVK
jgi:putative sterol carrier protein